jgi:5-methylcytosine-specific restriction endonuclease McrBC regulatory subunit McrC
MLNFSNDIFLGDVEQSGYTKTSNTNPFKFIISYLFIQSLEKAWVKGFPKSYSTQNDRGIKLKGSVNVNELIKKDLPYTGKIPFKYRNQHNVIEIVNVLYKAVSKVKSTYPNVINSNIHNITQDLAINRTNTFVNRSYIQKARIHRSLQNSMYADYKITLNYAELIIEDLNEIDEMATNLKTTGYLIDISKLYEIYLEKLLKNNLQDFAVSGQTKITSYRNSTYTRNLIPDLVLTNKKTGDVAVFDAKYKTLRLNSHYLGNDIDRSDFFQIHTYIGYYGDKLKIGGLIYPITGNVSDNLLPVENLFGNHSSSNSFTIDGINTGLKEDGDSFSCYNNILENERSFLIRFNTKLEMAFR